MLNLKKGLALVLAAATALTFAPVANLGAPVQVQAETPDTSTATVTYADSQLTVDPTDGASVDASDADQVAHINFKGLTASTSKIKVTSFGDLTTVKSGDTSVTAGTTEITVDAQGKASFDVTVPKGKTKKTYTLSFSVDNPSVTTDVTVTNTAASAIANSQTVNELAGATFQNVADTIYMRNVAGESATIKPTWVVAADNKSYDGSQLYYAIDDTVDGVKATLASAQYDARTKQLPEAGSKILEVASDKGSVKISRAADLKDAPQSFVLAAYTLDNNTDNYKLVGYKEIKVTEQINATFKLKLAQDSYALSLGINEKSDNIKQNIKVSDVQGKYLSDADITKFADSTNWTVSGDNIAVEDTDGQKKDDASVNAVLAKYKNNDRIYAVYIPSTGKFYANAAGSTKVTVSAVDDQKRVAQTEITLTVIGTSKYLLKATADGSAAAGTVGENVSNAIVLNVKTQNTYDLSKHMYKNDDSMVLSYESDNAKNTVNANTGVVTVTTPVDQFIITVTGKNSKGEIIAQTQVYFTVNALPYDSLTVTGEDKDAATVLGKLDYDAVIANNTATAIGQSKKTVNTVPSEAELAASQIQYVQIEVTGDEKTPVTESLNIVSTGGAIVTATLDKQSSNNPVDKVTNNGVITLKNPTQTGVAAIKLISSATSKNELTESYIFVVIDKKDNDTKLAPAAFKIGTDASAVDKPYTAGQKLPYQSLIDFKTEYKVHSAKFLDPSDDLLATKTLYPDGVAINQKFIRHSNDDAIVEVATAESKTAHVLLEYGDPTTGSAKYQIITITSVPGVTDTVTKIENASNNKVIYTPDMGTVVPQVVLDGVSTLRVTIAYPVDKNNTTSDISSTSLYTNGGRGTDPLNQNIMTATKEVKKAGDTYNTFYLYPTSNGTQAVWFTPSGNISETDRSIVHNLDQQLAVTFRSSATPKKVTGLKVKNKKGAKVTVTFDAATNHNMKYWVQKKIGKKVAGKSVASAKTTLSVKKGATIKVRVKAYYYDAEGNKHVGAYSKWVTKKTDKK